MPPRPNRAEGICLAAQSTTRKCAFRNDRQLMGELRNLHAVRFQ